MPSSMKIHAQPGCPLVNPLACFVIVHIDVICTSYSVHFNNSTRQQAAESTCSSCSREEDCHPQTAFVSLVPLSDTA
jgi:hypothetical protein